MIIMIFSKLMSNIKVTKKNALITFVLLRMLLNENNQHFNILKCGHIHTYGVVLHRFPSPLQFSPVFKL